MMGGVSSRIVGFNSAVDHKWQMKKMVPWGSSTRKPVLPVVSESEVGMGLPEILFLGMDFWRIKFDAGAPKAEVPRYLLHVCAQFQQHKCFFLHHHTDSLMLLETSWNRDFIMCIYWSIFVMINYSCHSKLQNPQDFAASFGGTRAKSTPGPVEKGARLTQRGACAFWYLVILNEWIYVVIIEYMVVWLYLWMYTINASMLFFSIKVVPTRCFRIKICTQSMMLAVPIVSHVLKLWTL